MPKIRLSVWDSVTHLWLCYPTSKGHCNLGNPSLQGQLLFFYHGNKVPIVPIISVFLLSKTHMLCVWYICLHFPLKSTKSEQIYHAWILWDMSACIDFANCSNHSTVRNPQPLTASLVHLLDPRMLALHGNSRRIWMTSTLVQQIYGAGDIHHPPFH